MAKTLSLTVDNSWRLYNLMECAAALELIGNIHGVRYTLTAVCPGCDHQHSAFDVLGHAHFTPDETDMICQRDHHVMSPVLIVQSLERPDDPLEVCRFMCAKELWFVLKEYEPIISGPPPPRSLQHSAAIVHGSVRNAMRLANGERPTITGPRVSAWKAYVFKYAASLSPITLTRILNVPRTEIENELRRQGAKTVVVNTNSDSP